LGGLKVGQILGEAKLGAFNWGETNPGTLFSPKKGLDWLD